jgi:hypothetical protein
VGKVLKTINVHSKTEHSAGTKIRPESVTKIPGGKEKQFASFIINNQASLNYFPPEQPPLILSDLLPMTPTP